MKNIILFSLFIVFLLFLAGCSATSGCGKYYLAHENTCCLDKNENSICDVDETTRATTVVRERPYLLVQELCDASSRFVCVDKTITSNFIKLRLRLNKDELVTVSKISFPELTCSQTFTTPEMKYPDEQEFTIPCVINQDAVASALSIEGTTRNYLRYSNGQVYSTTPETPVSFAGKVSGAVGQ
ncbi:hypothetical protein HZB00_02040 [Candidatus Woesearchaeota archaeon]|nr:hypothetical protein [Candidatus Woesearchaeota archaeon]